MLTLANCLTDSFSDKFDRFVRAHIERFSHKSITTADFKAHLLEFFADERDKLDTIDWETWLHAPGMPAYVPQWVTRNIFYAS